MLMADARANVLVVENLTLKFGGIVALSGISMAARQGQIVALIGPNGAGKTSLLNVISGFYKPIEGRIFFDSEDLLRYPTYARSSLGITRTFQNIALFRGLTVLENIKLGAQAQLKAGLLTSMIYLGPAKAEEEKLTRRIDAEIVDFLGLRPYRDREIAGLPLGIQRRVELARALISNPKLLMLDEPFAGMNQTEKQVMSDDIRKAAGELGITVLIIDHDMKTLMGLTESVVVLNFGKVIVTGTPAEIQRNPFVIEAYIGTVGQGAGDAVVTA
jgi:branched-chain amino acid transport system ATP-binding protein